jgi:two-component system, LytTR family, response regulator
MIRAYIVDDEQLAVQRLARLLGATGRVEIVGSTTDPEAALAFLSTHAVDVLFLDIQMPGLTGFELLERLETSPAVIFTTAYDVYALNAFEVNSIDYLLKPIEADRLEHAIDKIEKLGTDLGQAVDRGLSPTGGHAATVRALARLLAAELAPGRRLERLASRVGERTTIIDVSRVSHFAARDKLTFAVVNGREHAIDYTLAQLEERLDARRFARIHRSTIVNVPMIQELFPDVDSGILVRLKDDARTELSVARDRVRELKQRLGI